MILEYNPQYFAEGPGGEKTEEPTGKKLSDARDEGQVAKSQELNMAVGLFLAVQLLKFRGASLGEGFVNIMRWIFGSLDQYTALPEGRFTANDFLVLQRTVMIQMLLMMLPFFIVIIFIMLVVNILQVGWKITTKPMQPKLSKLNPLSGMKRLFSKDKLVELLKSVVKVGLIGYIAWDYLIGKTGFLSLLYSYDPLRAIKTVGNFVVEMGQTISIVYLGIGALDLLYQRKKFHDEMMMTKQEVKDEYKNSEGDPQVKGKIRQKMQEVSRARMMKAVPKADVVITNPTHYAVALMYDLDVADAPIVVAKGQDFIAKRIKEIAKEAKVEIVENKPLARMLYSNVKIGEMIPEELYQAVAEVLAYVYRLHGEEDKLGRRAG